MMIAFVYDLIPGMSNRWSPVYIECEMKERWGIDGVWLLYEDGLFGRIDILKFITSRTARLCLPVPFSLLSFPRFFSVPSFYPATENQGLGVVLCCSSLQSKSNESIRKCNFPSTISKAKIKHANHEQHNIPPSISLLLEM